MRAVERVVDETLARRTKAEVALGTKQWPIVRSSLCGNGFDIMFAKALGLDVRSAFTALSSSSTLRFQDFVCTQTLK